MNWKLQTLDAFLHDWKDSVKVEKYHMKCCVRPNSGPRNSGEFSGVPDSDLKPVLL